MFPVVAADRAAARDAHTIAQGVPSRALMQRAGAAAAAEIARRFGDRLARGVLVLAGPGNNGGDGWVVARALRASGHPVRVVSPVEPKTPDASAEMRLCHPERSEGSGHGAPEPDPSPAARDDSVGVVIDALLGTGASGAPRGPIAEGMALLRRARDAGAVVVALDLPSTLDATTGDAAHVVPADLTLTFGTLKRGHLVARDACGTIALLDIGLLPEPGDAAATSDAWIGDARHLRAHVAPIAADAHKGTRGKLAIVGGAPGMAGATILAARAALRSGVGMVKLFVAPESLPVVQKAEPLALAAAWPTGDADARDALAWADGVVLGPGLGQGDAAPALARAVLRAGHDVVLDADGLNLFAGRTDELRDLLGGRRALLTPHPAEAARLRGGGSSVSDVLARRWEVPRELAARTGAAILLKGVPTILDDGTRTFVSAAGTPVLATAGSGDLLAGIAGTLLIQGRGAALDAGWCAAWIHGRAAELAGGGRVRGVTLDDVLEALPRAWGEPADTPAYPVLLELPAVGEGRRAS